MKHNQHSFVKLVKTERYVLCVCYRSLSVVLCVCVYSNQYEMFSHSGRRNHVIHLEIHSVRIEDSPNVHAQ